MVTQGGRFTAWCSAVLILLALFPGSAAGVSLTLRTEVDPVPPLGTLVYSIRVNYEGASGTTAIGCFNPPPDCVNNRNNEYVCVRAFNEGANCGVGDPPEPGQGLCIQNPVGVCADGPNFGQPCTAPHGQPTDQCPPDEGARIEGIVVTLPIPPKTDFLSANKGGKSDGANIVWHVPPLEPCGRPETPQCPLLTARFQVADKDELPLGALIFNRASEADLAGSATSTTVKTTIGHFRMKEFKLVYPRNKTNRDRFHFTTFFTLGPDTIVQPETEEFRIRVETTESQALILDEGLPPGHLQQATGGGFVKFESKDPGLKKVVLRNEGPSHYKLILEAAKMDLPEPEELDVNVTLTLGDDVLTLENIRLAIKSDGAKFVGATTTTTSTTTTSTTVTIPTTTVPNTTSSTMSPTTTTVSNTTLSTMTPTTTTVSNTTLSTMSPTTTTVLNTTLSTITPTTTTVPTTPTTAPEAPPGVVEMCNNCVDDNNNGLGDLLDPACSPTLLTVERAVLRRERKGSATIKRGVIKGFLPNASLLGDAGANARADGIIIGLSFDDLTQTCVRLNRTKQPRKKVLIFRSSTGPTSTLRLKRTRTGRLLVRYKHRRDIDLQTSSPTAVALGIFGADEPYAGVTALREPNRKTLSAAKHSQ